MPASAVRHPFVFKGDGEVFTVLQASGNEFSVPWDVIHTITIGKKVQPLRHEGTKKKYEAYRPCHSV